MERTFRVLTALAIAHALLGSARAQGPATPPGSIAASPDSAAPAPERRPPDPPRTRFIAAMRYDFGLADAVQVQFADGHSESLKANGGYVLTAGAAVRPTSSPRFDLRGTIGFKYDGVDAANGSVRYLAFPVEVLAALNLEHARLAGGACVSLSPRFKGSGAASDLYLPLKSSLGLVAQAEWVQPVRAGAASLSVGARFAIEKMQAEAGGPATGANTFGLVVGVTL